MKKFIQKIQSLDKGTIIRTVLFICAIVNQIIAVIGMTSYATAIEYQIASLVVTVIVTATTAWKNNNFTYFAKLGSDVMHALKDGKLTKEEVLDLLHNAKDK